jgi:hypothetical protein
MDNIRRDERKHHTFSRGWLGIEWSNKRNARLVGLAISNSDSGRNVHLHINGYGHGLLPAAGTADRHCNRGPGSSCTLVSDNQLIQRRLLHSPEQQRDAPMECS